MNIAFSYSKNVLAILLSAFSLVEIAWTKPACTCAACTGDAGTGAGPKEPGLWESLPKFPVILEHLGYHTGYSGKLGVD